MDEVRTSQQRVLPCNSVELQKLLIDEQMRCETHRSNYQTLKEEHTRLGEEHLKLHQEVTDLHQDKQTTIIENRQKDEIIEALNQRVQLKAQELELMKTQVIDPSKLEALKAEISKKLEEPLKEQMIAMDKEVENYRTQYNKMRYEYTILKTELDHKDSRHKRLLEEQSLKFQAEISALKYERDELLKEEERRRCPADEDAIVQLRKAKAHLEQRIRVLEEEIEEERKSRDHRDRENEAVQKAHAQDLARTETQLKAMQVEKSSTESQIDRLKREATDKNERFTQLSNQLRQSDKQISHLRSELEEEDHQRRLAEGAHKVEIARQRGEMQRLRDSLSTQIKELETKLEIARGEAEQHAAEVAEVEARASCRVQDELKDEWTRYNALHADMTATADRLRGAEQKLTEERDAKRRVEEELRSKSAEAETTARGLRAELNAIKVQLSDEMTSQREERDRVEEMRVTREKLMRREADIREMSEAMKKMIDEKDQMMTDAKRRREEAEELCLKLKREKAETKRLLEEHDGTRMMEKQRMQSRIDQIECKLSKREDEMTSLKKQHKKVKSVCLHKLKSLSNELQLSNAQNQKLQIELRAGNYGVSTSEHERVCRKMQAMESRLRHFQSYLSTDAAMIPPEKPVDTHRAVSLLRDLIEKMPVEGATKKKRHRSRRMTLPVSSSFTSVSEDPNENNFKSPPTSHKPLQTFSGIVFGGEAQRDEGQRQSAAYRSEDEAHNRDLVRHSRFYMPSGENGLKHSQTSPSYQQEVSNYHDSNQPLNVKTCNQPLDVETSNQPLNVKTCNQPLDVETSDPPLDVKTSNQPLDVETSDQPLDVETSDPPLPVDDSVDTLRLVADLDDLQPLKVQDSIRAINNVLDEVNLVMDLNLDEPFKKQSFELLLDESSSSPSSCRSDCYC